MQIKATLTILLFVPLAGAQTLVPSEIGTATFHVTDELRSSICSPRARAANAVSLPLNTLISVAVEDPEAVRQVIRKDLEIWAGKPPFAGANTCGSGVDCCPASTAASTAQCLSLARAFDSQPDHWVDKILACIGEDTDWACSFWVVNEKPQLACSTVPATDSVRLADVARCAAIKAVVNF